jgi:hypothetical protein
MASTTPPGVKQSFIGDGYYAGNLTVGNDSSKGITSLGTLTAQKTSSQVILGITNTTTLSATAPSSSLTYTIPDAGASCNVQLGKIPCVTLTPAASVSLTVAQSGSLILMPSDTVGTTINLPALSAGLNYRIIFQATGDATHTTVIQVTGGAATLKGQILNCAAAALTSCVLPTTTITRSATIANTKVGDWIQVWCDGSSYWVTGVGEGNAATFSIT